MLHVLLMLVLLSRANLALYLRAKIADMRNR
jgi:hypothetical protein